MVVAAAFAADRLRTSPYLSVHIRTTLRAQQVFALQLNFAYATWGGIDRQFVRMVTDVYGAGGVITTAVRAVHTTVCVAADAATRRIRGQ